MPTSLREKINVTESERQRFIDSQAEILDEFARLAPGEDELLASFSQLALETYDTLTQQGVRIVWPLSTWPESAFFFLRPGNPTDKVPLSCLEKWRRWELGYPEVLARNPRLELRNLMQEPQARLRASSTHGHEIDYLTHPGQYPGPATVAARRRQGCPTARSPMNFPFLCRSA
jgi:hypothetical protein